MVNVKLPHGSNYVEVRIPEKNCMGIYSPPDISPVANALAEIKRAIKHPIGASALSDAVRGKEKVVIVCDDNTRLTPTDLILPVIIDEMKCGGIEEEQIKIIIALGTHRPMTREEIIFKFGNEVTERVMIFNHPFRCKEELVFLGFTSSGTPISVNKDAYHADFVLGIGSIVPHHIAGFSGGAKIIQPGISGEDTTGATHMASVMSRRSYLGLRNNPIRHDFNEVALKVGMKNIFNTVLNRDGKLVEAFYGDLENAYSAGVRKATEVYSVKIPCQADIVIASSHPCDIEFWQAHKALYAAELVAKEGGVIILLTPCPEGVAKNHPEVIEYAGKNQEQLIKMIKNGEISNVVAAALSIAWKQIRNHNDVFIVSDGMSAEEVAKMGFEHFCSVDDAIVRALAMKGDNAKIAVMTHAPDTLPLLPGFDLS